MTCVQIISVIKDLFIAAAAATTAIVAVIGLQSWKKELTGKAEFEAARSLIRATYKLREELLTSRTPFVGANEFPSEYPGPNSATPKQEAEAWGQVFQKRWSPIQDAMQDFDSATLESEALWSGDIRKRTDRLRKCTNKLFVAIESFVSDKATGGKNFEADREFGVSVRSEVFGSRNDLENELTKEITSAVEEIDAYVRPHLRRT